MKLKSQHALIILGGVLFAVLLYHAFRISKVLYNDLQAHNTQIADIYDYTKSTTPLPQSVIDDICMNFIIGSNDIRCQSDAVVYAPDFFPDILLYFENFPKKENIISIVEDMLGDYLVDCDGVNKEGIYRCEYDLRGDRRYLIFIRFTKEGYLYEIRAPIGGS